jgi:hypothetical protein
LEKKLKNKAAPRKSNFILFVGLIALIGLSIYFYPIFAANLSFGECPNYSEAVEWTTVAEFTDREASGITITAENAANLKKFNRIELNPHTPLFHEGKPIIHQNHDYLLVVRDDEEDGYLVLSLCRSGKVEHVFSEHVDWMAFSPDGETIVAKYSRQYQQGIIFYDANNFEELHRISTGEVIMTGLGFHPTEPLMAITLGSYDSAPDMLEIWNYVDWEKLAEYEFPVISISTPIFNTEGTLLVIREQAHRWITYGIEPE